jgi:hypothetical protein
MPHAVFAALRQGRGGGAAAAHRRDPFTRLDLVLMDTTSLCFEGAGGETLGQHGYSKDRRPDLRQTILAVLLDGDGRPVCSEMWPGNTADVTTVIPVIDRLRRRFDIARVCVVPDRGMIGAEERDWRTASPPSAAPAPGRKLSPIWIRSPRLRLGETASASPCAPRPPPASLSALLASHCRAAYRA